MIYVCDTRFGSSHNTPLSLEMVIACLDELGRGDVVEVIREEEEEKESPQVSYCRWC